MDAPLEAPLGDTPREQETAVADPDRDAQLADELREAIRRKVEPVEG